MAFPLHRRIQLDLQDETKRFFANAIHGKDFAATRDRSIAIGSLNTFKDINLEWLPTSTSRGTLRPYFGNMFGKIEWIGETTRNAFDAQISTLITTIEEDSEYLMNSHCERRKGQCRLRGSVRRAPRNTKELSMWLSTGTFRSPANPFLETHIPIHVMTTGTHTLVRDNVVEMIVGMQRIDLCGEGGESPNHVGVGVALKVQTNPNVPPVVQIDGVRRVDPEGNRPS
ncbi:hypothetical protein C8R43DRAFT_959696 [Mycena crocata]|nr:hypothetical protein C8R43DRAFT_959696 [Mycena crocata]